MKKLGTTLPVLLKTQRITLARTGCEMLKILSVSISRLHILAHSELAMA